MKKILSFAIVALAVILNLYLYFPETQILGDPNDNIFQYSLVNRTNWVWENYGCPISLACLPNLVDHNVTYWAEGYALPFYYSHLPQIVIVASHKLLIYPLTSLIGQAVSLFEYYNWTKYLLLALFPLPVFLALRIAGFTPIVSAVVAILASHYSTDGLYGIDPPSFLWRGYGLTSQLYAMTFMPLALAYSFKSFKTAGLVNKNTLLAVLFLVLTTAGHLGMGIISLIFISPFIFLDLNKRQLLARLKKLMFIFFALIFILSYWIIPILLYNNYHIISFWDPLWKFDSYGWYETAKQFLAGQTFDWQRAPVITYLTLFGFFLILLDTNMFVFALAFSVMMLLYFGRTTWGGLIDLVPGLSDFHLHRFIVGVHIGSLFLIAGTVNGFLHLFNQIADGLKKRYPRLEPEFPQVRFLPQVLFLTVSAVIFYLTAGQTFKYNSLNSRWIGEANSAYRYDEKNFQNMLSYLKNLPATRIYAGRPGNWGHDFRLGSSQIYMLLSVFGMDITQFLPETWSMMSENDQNFDERVAADYGLLNSRYIVAPENKNFPPEAKLTKEFGPFKVFEVPTGGWFEVVTSPMFVETGKTDFINIVHLWHRGYPRTWKMHPLISVDKNPYIPEGMERRIKMVNEVTYEENGAEKNIFSDFPFVFPESTPSGRLISEKVDKQTYSADVEVPAGCRSCFIMFKSSYHPNWRTYLDGAETEKFAVFPYYVAVKAPPGRHRIEVVHRPMPLKVFLLILEITAALSLVIYKLKPRR
ncbi:MAG: hypothetical protein UV73_C0005G0050 [Candidatus Gottesmanbacteria bacterium GW2011_GWA2_43_14]|uniref:Membrane protein 6-pyruvoyl-tetrahydropterin synthase-related domain-containing protein n=1 Tax=Candidatus Gottesmanbacteria bacterium GW2011_GWA2_43_14 TaxID=1618443 RepID=A0A0G1GG19_9BACT|nr:MAG: hypothetical protein UV73_C0005G0050 [Candidatus Gottesmanbacteria bacterium GW2011_GWA2_43_14]